MIIDSHVHCRDEEWRYKETIAHALEVARDSGVNAIFDMPNLPRPVFTYERAIDRIKIAENANIPEVFYGTFLGLTANPEQIKMAVTAWKKLFPKVVGFKLYAGHSTGELGVIREEDQQIVYDTLSKEGYEGILFNHSEKESEMNEHIGIRFDFRNPISHCMARPPQAEIESVKDQLEMAENAKFRGKLHIAHVSHIESVYEIKEAKKRGLDVSCGVCPHHLIFDYTKMFDKDGLLWKMNPPLREPGIATEMLYELRIGGINWIETDHAPHSLKEKIENPFASGIPGLASWPFFIRYLQGNDFSDELIRKITYENVAKRFGIDIKITKRNIVDRSRDYPTDVYSSLDKVLRQ